MTLASNKRILITGGAGFIGSHTADALIELGYRVRILDLLDRQIHGASDSFPKYIHPAAECIRGDVRSESDVNAALEGVDAVLHLAALTGVGQSMYDVRKYVDTNCVGTATLLEGIIKHAGHIQRMVLASSRAVYGEGTHDCSSCGVIYPAPRQKADLEQGSFVPRCPGCGKELRSVPTREDRPLNPVSVYALTKKHQEEQCAYIAKTFQIQIVTLRYFNVYGSRQSLKNPYTGIVSIFYGRLKSAAPISLYEHGRPTRDFVHISDVVAANVLALERDLPLQSTCNIGTGRQVSVLDVVKMLSKACKLTPTLQDIGEFRVGDIYSCYADLSRAKAMLGFKPQKTLLAGMEEFVSWAKNENPIDHYQASVDELQRHGLFGRTRSQA